MKRILLLVLAVMAFGVSAFANTVAPPIDNFQSSSPVVTDVR